MIFIFLSILIPKCGMNESGENYELIRVIGITHTMGVKEQQGSSAFGSNEGIASMSSWASSSLSSPLPPSYFPRISFMFDLIKGIMVFRMLWKRPGKRFSYYASMILIRWRSFGAEKQAGQLSVITGSFAF